MKALWELREVIRERERLVMGRHRLGDSWTVLRRMGLRETDNQNGGLTVLPCDATLRGLQGHSSNTQGTWMPDMVSNP